jgi:transcriptional regulator with XRE-family HTH domain
MTEDLREQIASRLRSARKAIGLSQGQVAKRLRVHRPTISEIEAGRRRVAAEELAQLAEIYGVPLEWFTSESHAEEDRSLIVAIQLLRALKHEDLDRVITWLARMQQLKDAGMDQGGPRAPTALVEEERTTADDAQTNAPEVRYMRCLYYDMLVGDQQAREDSRCSNLIPVGGDEEASYYCSKHRGKAPGAVGWQPATPEELDEICAALEARPADTPYLKVVSKVRNARSMKSDAGDDEKQLLRA